MPIRSKLSQFSQKSSYATDESPSESKSTQKETQPKPRTSIFDGMNTTNTPTSSSSASSDIANANAKLSESIANIRKDVQFIKQPVHSPRSTREFIKNPRLVAARAQQTADREMDDLMSRRVPAARRQQQATVDAIASAIDSADPISPPRFRTTPMKLGTKLGRQIQVSADRGIDVAGAIRLVQINCAVNGIRRQAALQKFHVRRGQRRKDLKSQRWRKLFKFSFDETVKKIQRMRDQGW
jgi:hypothetical protein